MFLVCKSISDDSKIVLDVGLNLAQKKYIWEVSAEVVDQAKKQIMNGHEIISVYTKPIKYKFGIDEILLEKGQILCILQSQETPEVKMYCIFNKLDNGQLSMIDFTMFTLEF
jgi:hypothetical protein